MTPNPKYLQLGLFVDVYFAGFFTLEYRHDSVSMKNRTGSILSSKL